MSIREKALIYAWLTSLTIFAIGILIYAYRIQTVILSHAAAIEIMLRWFGAWPELPGFPGVIA